jgi:lipopolysaccharide/colanic/teichoic acid biosynthesis glycosyltransferase
MSRKIMFLPWIDAAVLTLAYVLPLWIFPEKSYFRLQIFLGSLNAVTALVSARSNRLAWTRSLFPSVEMTYGPIVGIFSFFFFLSFISFVDQDYAYSRLINTTGLLSSVLYIVVSRRILFPSLIMKGISAIEKQPATQASITVECKHYSDSSGQSRHLLMINQAASGHKESDALYLGFSGDPQRLMFNKMTLLNDIPVLELGDTEPDSNYGDALLSKRIFDLVFAIVLSVLLFPVTLLATIAILVIHRVNPFFTQERIGLKGKPFTIVKLRTFFGPENRASPLGRFLRRSNMDEIPQLLNIIKGEMSLVGPRAEIPSRNIGFSQTGLLRNILPPGLTGFWQLSPYRTDPIHNHVEYDLQYLITRSLLLDIVVLLMTPFYAFKNNSKK